MSRLRVLAAALALAAAACKDGPQPGPLVVEAHFTTPPRAMMVTVVGPVTDVGAPEGSGYRVYAVAGGGDTTRVAVLAQSGATIAEGALLRIAVPDVGQVAAYTARPEDVAGADYRMLNPGFYQLTVIRP